jgi:Protein of unknown function (DUF3551)
MLRTIIAAAAVTTALSFGAPAAQAGTFGNAPWCAVQNLGVGDMVWDCEYRSVEECQPQVIAGNRGFCNLNPYFVAPAYGPAPLRHRKRSHA